MWTLNSHIHLKYFQFLSEAVMLPLSGSASFNSFRVSGCGVKCPWVDPITASCNTIGVYFWTPNQMPHERLSEWFQALEMFSIFSGDGCFFSACLVLLTAEEDACNEEGGGSSEGGWSGLWKYFHFLRRTKEERRPSITFKNQPVSNIRGGN